MDKRLIFKFRLAGAVLLALSIACFVIILPIINKPLTEMDGKHLAATIGFWLSIVGFYGTFFHFSHENKPYNQYKGNKAAIKPAIVLLVLFLISSYWHFHMDHVSVYEATLILVASITYGLTVFFAAVIFIVHRKLMRGY